MAAPLIQALQSGNLSAAGRHFYNSLQHPAEQLNEDVLRLKTIFESQSCYGHLMSGSGTSYFGICANRQHARSVAARVRQLSRARVYTVQARC
jgi:4-diphosphocytidyl-2-C-methyl-D-erythritol kinase